MTIQASLRKCSLFLCLSLSLYHQSFLLLKILPNSRNFPPVVASNVYREDDRPAYRRGNRVLLVLNIVSIILIIATKAYYMWRNKQRTRKWAALTEDEKAQYLEEHKDETGPSRLDFTLAS